MEQQILEKINLEINQLIAARNQILKEEREKNEEYIRSLKWTESCSARLEINPFAIAGMYKYQIKVYGKDVPKIPLNGLSAFILIIDDPEHYYNDLHFGTDGDGNFYFRTNSEDNLIKLLKTVKFNSFSYDKKLAELLVFLNNNF